MDPATASNMCHVLLTFVPENCTAMCDVKISENPRLKIAHRGDPLGVSGVIEQVSMGIRIIVTLREANLMFP